MTQGLSTTLVLAWLAVSLGFEVPFATLITLVLVPTAYMILDDIGRTMRRVLRGATGRGPTWESTVCGEWTRPDAGPPLWHGDFSSGQGLYVTTAAGCRPDTLAARRCGAGPGESATE